MTDHAHAEGHGHQVNYVRIWAILCVLLIASVALWRANGSAAAK
jgi:ABC-type Fe3+-siderophore transport system permease subunit